MHNVDIALLVGDCVNLQTCCVHMTTGAGGILSIVSHRDTVECPMASSDQVVSVIILCKTMSH